MKPDFALTLSFEGISLLRRVPGGWTPVGDVALDAADLRGALADLRSDADALSPNGGQVKLIIPNEQIKYLSIVDSSQTGDALQQDIRLALDGATPYTVDELSFDWSHADGSIQIAAVANETLDEAEAFAKSHHFQPVCFVAVPPEGEFTGEVFFGPAASWTGSAPLKDAHPMSVVAAPEDAAPPPISIADIEAPTLEESIPGTSDETGSFVDEEVTEYVADAEDALAPGAADLDGDDAEKTYRVDPAADDPDAPDLSEQDYPAAPPRLQPTLTAQPPEDAAPLAFASIRASRSAPAPAEVPAAPRVETPVQEAPAATRFKLGGARKSTRDSDVTAPVLQVDPVEQPDVSEERKGFGFFSRRKSRTPEQNTPIPPQPVAPQSPPAKRHDPEPARAAVARIAAMRAGRQTDPAPTSAATVQDERARMTVFGARTEPQIGGKPRFLGLMLTSALLIFLLAVAAWASVFLDEGLSRIFDRDPETPSIARMPDVELLPLDGSVTAPEEDDSDVQFAALDMMEAPSDTVDGLSDLLPPPVALTPEEADARYAATGIWQRSPELPETPMLTSLDDLYIASIDSRIQQFDAVALPGAEALRNDRTYLSHTNPAAPGTRFTLDDRGLVIATPEGTINPEGVRVFAGLPPVVPPIRPTPDAVLPEAPADGTAESAVSPELEGFRPRVRPTGLIEGNERAQLAGRTRVELAALRPLARPETLKAEEEQSQPDATEYAVAQSIAPVTRPRNFAQVVEQARSAPPPEEPAEVRQVAAAAVAPRVVQPSIPSTANVARQATVTNALNLRRINLIGVYGKPSNRRALVRLGNGRYQKVKVGDTLDGGRVAAIGDSELRYSKNGRNVVLDMPDG